MEFKNGIKDSMGSYKEFELVDYHSDKKEEEKSCINESKRMLFLIKVKPFQVANCRLEKEKNIQDRHKNSKLRFLHSYCLTWTTGKRWQHTIHLS